jgi:hypothetical protein
MSEEKEICFVIMPFSKTTSKHTRTYWTAHFKDFLKPLIEENGTLEARRSKPLRGGVLSEIITALVTSPVVVADVTDQNPNVFWELGVRQSFRHGTVTIAEEGTKLPFDVSSKGTLFYSNDRLKNEDFRRDFKDAVLDSLEHPERPDSQVFEILSGRGTLFEIFRRDEAMRRLEAVLSEIEINNQLQKRVIKTIQANQEKRKEDKKGVVIPTERLIKSAAELLWVDRYVDEDKAFFESASQYITHAIAINHTMGSWEYDWKTSESWLLSEGKSWNSVSKQFEERVKAALEKVSKRF